MAVIFFLSFKAQLTSHELQVIRMKKLSLLLFNPMGLKSACGPRFQGPCTPCGPPRPRELPNRSFLKNGPLGLLGLNEPPCRLFFGPELDGPPIPSWLPAGLFSDPDLMALPDHLDLRVGLSSNMDLVVLPDYPDITECISSDLYLMAHPDHQDLPVGPFLDTDLLALLLLISCKIKL